MLGKKITSRVLVGIVRIVWLAFISFILVAFSGLFHIKKEQKKKNKTENQQIRLKRKEWEIVCEFLFDTTQL